MEKHPVALIPIATYDQAAVDTAVLQGVDLLGGIARFVQPEERILLKPNLLSRALPQKAITTHPAVFSAVCHLLRESGYTHLSYGDSPGNPTTARQSGAGIRHCGGRQALRRRNGGFLLRQCRSLPRRTHGKVVLPLQGRAGCRRDD